MSTQPATQWSMKGTVLISCNCDYGCPCNFNALPSRGYCEGGWTWHVDQGSFGGTQLDDLNFTVMVKWPGAIHEGNGEAIVLVDDRADEAQREAISTLVEGNAGGPWGILAWTWPTVHGPKAVAYEVELKGIETRVKAGDALRVESRAIKNPVSGAEVHPSAVLPEGIIVKSADFGASSVFMLDDEIGFDHTGQYTAVGSFDYSGP
jgi:hypothetical protein